MGGGVVVVSGSAGGLVGVGLYVEGGLGEVAVDAQLVTASRLVTRMQTT